MAIPPQFAARRWGCAICGDYPRTSQVYFHADADAAAETEAAKAAWRARTSQPGWTGPQRKTFPHGVWLCAEHAAAAEPFRARGREPGMAALKAALGD
jgi:hypothetical protein